MTIYKSKVDAFLFLPLIFGLVPAILISFKVGIWWPVFATVIIILPLSRLLFGIKYTINDSDKLLQIDTPLSSKTIDIRLIYSIDKSNSILSAPASSLDRIAIKLHSGYESVISPNDRRKFIDQLVRLNDNIIVLHKY